MHKQIRYLLLMSLLWIAVSGLMADIGTVQRNNDLAALNLTGEQYPVQGWICTYTVTVRNTGTTFQSNYTVKLMQGDTELASAQGLPIDTLQTLQIPIILNPMTSGETQIYGKVVLIGDTNPQNDCTDSLYLDILPMGSFAYTVGEGDEEHYVPWNLCWHYSLQESMFYPNELNFIGMITQIAFYSNFGCDIPGSNVTIWMGTTTQPNLDNGWIPSSQLTQVYNGTVDIPIGPTPFVIELPTPFLYLGDNLVLLAKHGLDPIYYTQQLRFFSQTEGTNRARLYYSDTINPDSANPSDPGTLSGIFPKTTFMYVDSNPFTSLRGTVYGNNVPLQGATVSISNTTYHTTTSTQGNYQMQFLLSMGETYQVTASKPGYLPLTQSIVIPDNLITFLNFHLQPAPTVNISGQIRGSDNLSQGLPDAIITLDGDNDYSAVTDSIGEFSIPGIYLNTSYLYAINHSGFIPIYGSIQVTTTDYDIGLITLTERYSRPRSVMASLNTQQTVANISWTVPNPDTTYVSKSAENVTCTRTDRSLLGYKVWRLQQGQENDFTLWTLLTPNIISETSFADSDWNGHGTEKWAVKAVYSNDNVSTAAFSNAISGVFANQDETAAPTALLGCYPNPCSDRAVIKYQLSEPSTVSLRIYNIKGQLVKVLLNQPMKEGQAQTVWDGTDNNNNHVSKGLYYIRMQAGGYTSTRKILFWN